MRPSHLLRILSLTLIQFDSSAQQTDIPESAIILSEYIQHESITGNEKDAGKFFAEVCRQKGLHVEVFTNETDSYNFSASLYPLALDKPNIVFLNHIDVVPTADTADWTYPPFSGTIVDGMVWGRGAIDLKGLAVMQLIALANFSKRTAQDDVPYNVTLLCVSQEEDAGSLGAQRVVREHFQNLNPVVVFGEGGAGISGLLQSNSDQKVFCISVSEKQALWLKLTLNISTSGHGSVPPLEYANKEMVKALGSLTRRRSKIRLIDANVDFFHALGRDERGPRGFVLRHTRLFKPLLSSVFRKDPKILAMVSNTLTLTNLNNPFGATNQIAQEISATLDCRLLPGANTEEFIAEIRKQVKNVKIQIELETVNAKPSPIKNDFYQNFKSAITHVYPEVRVVPYMFPAYTDNNYFRNLDVPVYGIMPVHLTTELLNSIHNVDERLPIASLESGIQVYTTFLERILTASSSITSIKRNR